MWLKSYKEQENELVWGEEGNLLGEGNVIHILCIVQIKISNNMTCYIPSCLLVSYLSTKI
jgi:hypothetical protein